MVQIQKPDEMWKIVMHNNELHELYASPNIIRVIKSRGMKQMGHVAHMGENKNTLKVLVGKPEGKGPLATPGLRKENNIKMDL